MTNDPNQSAITHDDLRDATTAAARRAGARFTGAHVPPRTPLVLVEETALPAVHSGPTRSELINAVARAARSEVIHYDALTLDALIRAFVDELVHVGPRDHVWAVRHDLTDYLRAAGVVPAFTAVNLRHLIAQIEDEVDSRRASHSGRAGADDQPLPLDDLAPRIHVLFSASLLRELPTLDTLTRLTALSTPSCGLVLRPVAPRLPAEADHGEPTDNWIVTDKAGRELARVVAETVQAAGAEAGKYQSVRAAQHRDGGINVRRLRTDELRQEQPESGENRS